MFTKGYWKMKLKAVSGITLILLFIGMLTLASNTQPVQAAGTIYIRADGSVDPPTANITSVDNIIYTFSGNIHDEIVVERDDIVVDGAGYTVEGPGPEVTNSKGIDLAGRSNVTIKNMKIGAFYYGIYLIGSSNNTISGNNITNNWDGIYLIESSNNTISGNNMTNNNNGIVLNYSSNNFLQSNLLDDNQYGFGFLGLELSHFLHSIDNSNRVDGKPVYYLISQHDLTINPSTHLEVGFLALINSTNITIEGLTMTKNRLGLLIAYTNNTKIQNNNITNNVRGIYLCVSSNNTISGNNITMNFAGIWLSDSSNNTLYKNNIMMNPDGIELSGSSNNTLYRNTIKNNVRGIVFYDSSNNRIYHNNLIDNTQQVYIETSGHANFWDDGYPSGGNYWSDYGNRYPDAEEIEGRGVWDRPYFIDRDNQDNYPLMYPWSVPPRPDTMPPTISIVSPENKTYLVEDVPLVFTLSESTSWIGYSLDGQMNTTITGNTTLSELSDGSYSLIVYAKDTAGNAGVSEIIYFSISNLQPEVFPFWMQGWFYAIVAVVIVVLVGAVYFMKKRKPPTAPLPSETRASNGA